MTKAVRTASDPIASKAKKASLFPKWSAIHPAAGVLNVAPMPIPNPTAPRDKLKCPDRPATSLTTKGTMIPKHAPAMPSKSCAATSSVGF